VVVVVVVVLVQVGVAVVVTAPVVVVAVVVVVVVVVVAVVVLVVVVVVVVVVGTSVLIVREGSSVSASHQASVPSLELETRYREPAIRATRWRGTGCRLALAEGPRGGPCSRHECLRRCSSRNAWAYGRKKESVGIYRCV